ncbi:hypothetical protein RCJ22_31430, partial [Vibrio sp. FNV 38]|nr:hypothetical protein [Vibrio sp. FNV 38]
IESNGFEILKSTKEIPGDFRRFARGNNWDRGPWPVSGGNPAEVIIAYNRQPQFEINEVGFKQDVRIKRVKSFIRKETEKSVCYRKQFNGLHTTDCTAETLEYSKYLSEEFECEIVHLINQRKDINLKDFDVVEDMTRFGRRANVYLSLI